MSKFTPLSRANHLIRNGEDAAHRAAPADDKHHESDLLTVKEAADLLRCSKSYLDKMRCTGGGPEFVRLGVRKILYRRVDLLNWAKARRFDSTSQYGQ